MASQVSAVPIELLLQTAAVLARGGDTPPTVRPGLFAEASADEVLAASQRVKALNNLVHQGIRFPYWIVDLSKKQTVICQAMIEAAAGTPLANCENPEDLSFDPAELASHALALVPPAGSA
jgi:hypothetical protein